MAGSYGVDGYILHTQMPVSKQASQRERSVGGQKKRWSDVVVSDLRRGDPLEDWRKITQNRGAWRCLLVEALVKINKQAKVREKERKDERNEGGKEMRHQSHYPGSVRKLVVLSFVSPRMAWSICAADSWMDGRNKGAVSSLWPKIQVTRIQNAQAVLSGLKPDVPTACTVLRQNAEEEVCVYYEYTRESCFLVNVVM